MRSVILHAPHLGRDLRPILEKVPDAEIYEGEPTERGEDGCLIGHVDIITSARDEYDPEVFIMEDDCMFTDAFVYEQWKANAIWAKENGYDVLVGGCVQTYDPKVVRMRGGAIVEVSSFHSAHCYVVFETGYEKIITTAIQPYDVSIGRDGKCKIAMVWPFVAHQRPVFSGILKRDVNYVPLYEQYESLLGMSLGLK